MEPFYTLAVAAIGAFASERLCRSIQPRLSRKAMLAAPCLPEAEALRAAAVLKDAKADCLLLGAPLLRSVTAEDGWLLFTLDSAAFDAYAMALPEDFQHREDYVDRRMELLMRHGDAPLPPCDALLWAVLTASHASARGKWTEADERAVLTMTHTLKGMERVRIEHAAARAAKMILYERRMTE